MSFRQHAIKSFGIMVAVLLYTVFISSISFALGSQNGYAEAYAVSVGEEAKSGPISLDADPSEDDGYAYTAAHNNSSTAELGREIEDMSRTNCGDPSIDAETCATRIANRQMELTERCEKGDRLACNILDRSGDGDAPMKAWVAKAEQCGQGDMSACEAANKIIEESPEANWDACSNGSPYLERCGPIREAQEKGLLK